MRKVLIIFLMIVYACMPALAEEANMLVNPGFDALDSSALPEGWYKDMWDAGAGVSYLEASSDGYEGNGIKVMNASENDARFCQDVAVEPDTIYEIRCMAKAEGISDTGIGANISVKGTFSYSDQLYDTDGEWVELIVYGKTGGDQDELTLCARLGGYSGTTTGSAWFDSFSMKKVDAAPEGFAVLDFDPPETSSKKTTAAADTDAEPARYTEAWLLTGFGIALAFLALYRRRGRLTDDGKNGWYDLGIVLLIALAVRLVIAFMVRGYYTDINCFTLWAERMYAKGPLDFYSTEYFCDYPPLYMVMLGIIAFIRNLLGIEYMSTLHIVLIKLLPILFDLGIAALTYAVAKKQAGVRIAMLAAVICALNPAAIIDSAAWGQIDSVFTFFTVLAAVNLCARRYIAALPVIVVAMLIKPQALLFAPLGLAALVIDICRHENRRQAVIDAVSGLVIGVALLLACGVIFHADGVSPVEWLIGQYSGTMQGYPRITINAFNLYQLMGLNWVKLTEEPLVTNIAWVLFGASYLYSAFIYWKAKRTSALYLSASALIMLICAFGPMIHERYVYPAIVLLALAYVSEKDWRIMVSLAVLSVTLFMNQVLVLQGGMTAANYGHLNSSENTVNAIFSILTVLNALFIAYVSFDIVVLGRTFAGAGTGRRSADRARMFTEKDWKLHLKAADYIIMAAVTLVYSVAAFTNLGSMEAPQTIFTSSQSGESVVFDLGETKDWRMEYYGGICNTAFTVEISNNGDDWTEPVHALYKQGEISRWLFFTPMDESFKTIYDGENIAADGTELTYATYSDAYPYQTSRYIRITADSAGLNLMEVAFQDADGAPMPVSIVTHEGFLAGYESAPIALIDEQDTVPEHPSYYNSTYFDEIYHARTAYEHLHGLNTYEWTHPPLGKVLMMVGIKLFGMTPFGWRFMGAVMGVAMLPVMYLMAKQLSAKRGVATLCMALMALDSMHFTQTRIATIDSYAVFWIMLMYLFMFRYVKMNFHMAPLKKTLVPLALCGVTMGVAWATKWIGIYASAGLAVLFFWSFIKRFIEHRRALAMTDMPDGRMGRIIDRARNDYWKNALITTAVCIVFFIVVPLVIYYLSYYWHMQAQGGLSIERVVDLQETILNYHSGLGDDDHYFRSPWYQWPVIAWPMWYYSGNAYLPSGTISSISCMGNPAVWWTGLIAIVALGVYSAWQRRADKTGFMVIVGFLSQYLPWVIVPRSTFIYHYFASVPFIILATGLFMGKLQKKNKAAFWIAFGLLIAAALTLFIMFYPIESGMPMSAEYAKNLKWFDWYNYANH